MSWQEIRDKKKAQLDAAIPSEWKDPEIKAKMEKAGVVSSHEYLDSVLPVEEVKITALSVGELAAAIKAKQLTSYEVTKAFCHRAALAHQILNCCVEIFFDDALKRAKEVDEYYEKNGSTIGPLHGVPLTLKDQFDLVGKDSSIGYCALFGRPATKNSVLVDYLLEQGAVFYVKTTVPVAMMSAETESNIMGYTLNGVNNKMSCGGSSGGEGALIASGGAVLGFGTDIGGSIRIPSSFQGLYALKPSTGRVSYMDVSNSYAYQELVPSVIGPMGKSLKDVNLIFELIVKGELWNIDPKVLSIPWKSPDEFAGKEFKFGFWKDDGNATPQRAILRCLDEVQHKIKASGAIAKDVDFDLQPKLLDTIGKVFGSDAYHEIGSMTKKTGEPDLDHVKWLVLKEGIDEPLNVNEWWEVSKEVYERKQQFYADWKKWGIDVLVCPIWPSAAFKPHSPHRVNYTCPFNITDCASVVIPVGKVDSKVDGDPDWNGMPVCVQVVARRSEEEKALYAAGIIDKLVNGV